MHLAILKISSKVLRVTFETCLRILYILNVSVTIIVVVVIIAVVVVVIVVIVVLPSEAVLPKAIKLSIVAR